MSLFWRAPGRAADTFARDPGAAVERRETVPIPFGAWRLSGGGNYQSVDTESLTAPLQSVAVAATVDLIASLGSELPVDVYSGQGGARRKIAAPSYLLDPGGDGHGLEDWIYQGLVSWLLRGNLYGNILARDSRGPNGFPTQVQLLAPDSVRPDMDRDGNIEWHVGGRQFPAAQMWHKRINPIAGQLLGCSPVAFKARQLGISLRSAAFGDQWFADGAHPSAMLTNSEIDMSPAVARAAKDRFLATLYGSREPLVMGKGWQYQKIQVNPEESQFLQTQGWSEAQCARIFGPGYAEILGYESGGSLTYATVEGRFTHLLVASLGRWLSRVDRLITAMLPRPQYAKLNRAAMLQSTTLDRYRAHELALRDSWRTVNEVREIEDLPPVDWGDEPIAIQKKPAEEPPPSDPNQKDGTDA